MKRLALSLVVLGALAAAPAAMGYVDPTATQNSVSGNGTWGTPTNTFRMAFRASRTDRHAVGNAQIYGSDADHHMHSFTGTVACMAVDATGTNASVLIQITNKVNEPDALYGVLIHVTDGDTQANENGANDAMDLTNLNQNQFNGVLSAGCAAAPGTVPLTSGNITVVKSLPPTDNTPTP